MFVHRSVHINRRESPVPTQIRQNSNVKRKRRIAVIFHLCHAATQYMTIQESAEHICRFKAHKMPTQWYSLDSLLAFKQNQIDLKH